MGIADPTPPKDKGVPIQVGAGAQKRGVGFGDLELGAGAPRCRIFVYGGKGCSCIQFSKRLFVYSLV